ncbi:MAG: beta-ketoacyl-[acyl-carrier-protein] synthase family protein [Polyangia bacterium]
MNREPVVITGLGVLSALGPDLQAFAAGLRSGRTGIRRMTLFDASDCRSELAGECAEPSFASSLTLPSRTSRPDRFGLRAALDAVADAGLSPEKLTGAGLIFGTGTGGAADTEDYLRQLLAGGLGAPGQLISHQPSAVTDLVARVLGLRGPRSTVMTACSSSALAISQARDLIQLGRAPIMLAGGAEGLCRLTSAGFGALRATSPELCRPFDVDRKGLNLGEGAAVLVLESESHARRRGARIHARLLGSGLTCDAHHMTAPHPEGEGALRAMRLALTDAALGPEALGYINAHGTGTPHNDAAESTAVSRLLGERRRAVPMSSIKSMVGHTLGAAGAIEAVASVVALTHGFLPPTVNLMTPDPAFDLDFIPGAAREQQVDVVLSSSFAFGGNNAALLFGRA